MAKQVILTDDGLKKYELELEDLKTRGRTDIAAKIKVALSFGDLSENSEYDEAKNEQAKLEARIVQIEAMLKNAKVIDEEDISTDKIDIGSKVTLRDAASKKDETYKIVGSAEADPKNGMISDESPIGKAILGKKVNATVTVDAPMGELKFKIMEISR